ncbi:gamma-glutamyltransferase, partial [bacterium]|nr:gamma-glutamyltransferase [bacterium]
MRRTPLMNRILLLGFLLTMTFPPPAPAADRITGRDFATRSEVIARHCMAATSQPLATQIALD